VALATLLCVFAAAPAAATTLDRSGLGPRSLALGNASEAIADDYYALWANPANLALARHIHFGLGGDAVLHRFGVDRLGGQDRYPTQFPADNYLAHVGISSPLPGWLEGLAAIGVAVQLPVGGPTRLASLDHRTPQLPLYDTLGDRLALIAGLGIRPVRWLALGASVQVLTSLSGRAAVGLSPIDHRVTHKSLQVDLSTDAWPILAATWLPDAAWRVGLVWRSRSYVAYALPLSVDVERIGQLDFSVAGIGLWLPETLAAAASWQHGAWLVTAGLAWQRWSRLPPLAPDVSLRLDARALAPSGQPGAEVLYARNAPIAVGARDIATPRIGVEWRPAAWAVIRSGLQHRPTPLPRANGEANYLDAPATTASLGGGLTLDDPSGWTGRPLHIDAALAWTVLTRRTVQKLDPADPTGATSLYGQGWQLGLALHHDF
jgi:hypothetical protein